MTIEDDLVKPCDLLGVRETCVVAGISRQRFSALLKEGRAPKPVIVLACGPIWTRPQIEEWAAERTAQRPQ